MSSSDRITQSKGKPKELSLPTRTRQKRKSPSREAKQEMNQQPTGLQRDRTNYSKKQLFMHRLYQLNHPGLLLPSLLQVPQLEKDHAQGHYL